MKKKKEEVVEVQPDPAEISPLIRRVATAIVRQTSLIQAMNRLKEIQLRMQEDYKKLQQQYEELQHKLAHANGEVDALESVAFPGFDAKKAYDLNAQGLKSAVDELIRKESEK